MSQIVRDTLQIQIDQLTREILNATEKAWEAQKNNDSKQNVFWLEEKQRLTEERSRLQQVLYSTPTKQSDITPKTRAEIKESINRLNKKAKEADQKMRLALEDKQLSQANTFLRERNQLNAEVKKLQKILNPVEEDPDKTMQDIEPTPEEIKQKIRKYNQQAKIADQKMRQALNEHHLEKANELLQQRNYLNAEVKKLTVQLTPPRLSEKKPEVVSKPQTSQVVANTVSDREILKKRIRELNAQALQSDKKMREALAEKRFIKANELLQIRNQYNTESKILLSRLKLQRNAKNKSATVTIDRDAIKAQIRQHNEKAQQANVAMHAALKEKQYAKSKEFLAIRNKHNAEVKALTLLLNPPKELQRDEDTATAEKTPVVSDSVEKIEKQQAVEIQEVESLEEDPSFATQLAEKYVNYRLEFTKHFYKKIEIEKQIEAEQEEACAVSNEKIEDLHTELSEHVRCPPPCYVEDNIHDGIILHLLDKKDERGVAYFEFPEISDTTIGAPVCAMNCHNDLINFVCNYTEEGEGYEAGKRILLKHFIRDIMQIKAPMTVCDLVLHDAIMDTATQQGGFVQLFDQLVDEVNEEILRLHGASDDPMMPTVIRPINSFKGLAHRDAIQLIPPYQDGIDQFSGAVLSDVTIQDNLITSIAKLQGIFSTDGAFENLKIINNQIRTEGEHKISILGMLSGEISGNTDLEGNPLDVKIQPLRLGGGTSITNLFVLGFSEGCSYQYGHIEGISDTPLDGRQKKVVKGKGYDPRTYLIDFNMDSFVSRYKNHDKERGRFETTREIVEEMIEEGEAIKCNTESLQALEDGVTMDEAIKLAKQPMVVNNPVDVLCESPAQEKM